jgi:DNA-directed RNA polymerase subunit M/transcription elongation factor TFIIS
MSDSEEENEEENNSDDEKEDIEEEEEELEDEEIEEEDNDYTNEDFVDDNGGDDEDFITEEFKVDKIVKVSKRNKLEKKYIKANKKEEDRDESRFISKINSKNPEKSAIRKILVKLFSRHIAKIAESVEKLLFDAVIKNYSDSFYDININFSEFWINSFNNVYGLILLSYEENDKKQVILKHDKLRIILTDLQSNKLNFKSNSFNDSQLKYLTNFKLSTMEMEVEDGIDTCKKCNKSKTTRVTLQLRSCDEPPTNFIRCISCGNKWKY